MAQLQAKAEVQGKFGLKLSHNQTSLNTCFNTHIEITLRLGRACSSQGLTPGPGAGERRDESTSQTPMASCCPHLDEVHRDKLQACGTRLCQEEFL